jgi:hypothetical protein
MRNDDLTKVCEALEENLGTKIKGFVVAALQENDEIAVAYHKLNFVERVGLSSTLNFDMNYLPNHREEE